MVEEDFVYYFNAILTKGKKDNTYKFALARSLIDYCYKKDISDLKKKVVKNESELIEFQTLSKDFLKYYWHQILKYKIKQNFNSEKPPLVVNIIKNIFEKNYNPKDTFRDVEMHQKDSIILAENKIAKVCFREVIPKFHNIPNGNDKSNEIFYEQRKNSISVKPQAMLFFRENYVLLYKTVILEWSKFLEKINRGLPMLISKIETDEIRRSSPEIPYKILRKHFNTCFYCKNSLSTERKNVHVDHFIPWSYVFENEIWNLVLACEGCNNDKRDSLYPIERIIERNTIHLREIEGMSKSLAKLDPQMDWQREIRRQYQNCVEQGFRMRFER
jgi:5-methylcytosine-specific restriction endonuclease McrA